MSDEAQTIWYVCHEFALTPSQVFDLTVDDYDFLVSGLDWFNTKQNEANKHA